MPWMNTIGRPRGLPASTTWSWTPPPPVTVRLARCGLPFRCQSISAIVAYRVAICCLLCIGRCDGPIVARGGGPSITSACSLATAGAARDDKDLLVAHASASGRQWARDPVAVGVGGGLGAIGGADLVEDVADVARHRVQADQERGGDLPVAL